LVPRSSQVSECARVPSRLSLHTSRREVRVAAQKYFAQIFPGQNVGGPPPKPLPEYVHRIDGTTLYIQNRFTEEI